VNLTRTRDRHTFRLHAREPHQCAMYVTVPTAPAFLNMLI